MKEVYVVTFPSYNVIIKYYPKCGNYYYNVISDGKYVFPCFERVKLTNLTSTYGVLKIADIFHTTKEDICTRMLKGMRYT